MTRTLVVTNDFPPRPGGIQQFVHSLVDRFPPDDVVVYASSWRGAEAAGDVRAVPLLLAVMTLLSTVSGPVANLVSRRVEARADVYSLDLTRDAATFSAAQQRLARTNLSDLEPHPLAFVLFATHPSTTQRLALAREWQRLRG